MPASTPGSSVDSDDRLIISGKHYMLAVVMQMLGKALAVLRSVLKPSKQATVVQTDNKTQAVTCLKPTGSFLDVNRRLHSIETAWQSISTLHAQGSTRSNAQH